MTRWRRHEERARRSSFFRGYRVEEQKHSRSTGRQPDYFAVSKDNPKDRRIGEAKYVRKLTQKHIDQVKTYKGHPFYAKKAAIFVKQSTRVTKDVKKAAKEANIKIIRKRARRSS